MENKTLSKSEYYTYYSLLIVLTSLVWIVGINMVVLSLLSVVTNNQALLLLLLFFTVLVLTAITHSKFDIQFKEYRLKVLRDNQIEKGLNNISITKTKQELAHILESKGFSKINGSTYGIKKKNIFKNVVYVVTFKQYKRFKKFNESDKLYNQIVKKFSLPSTNDIIKNPKRIRTFKVKMFEVAFIEKVNEEDIKLYIDDFTLSIVHKLHSIGVLYDMSLNRIIYCDLNKSDRVMKELIYSFTTCS